MSVPTIICTLFERTYHYGVGALANSLYASGYRGRIYVGYRGDLPPWLPADLASDGHPVYEPVEGLALEFMRLETDRHLTNYKPDFMLRLLDNEAQDADTVFYLDPDICVTEPWRQIERWLGCGVCLCEDVNSPLHANHPRRVGWRRYFADHGFELRNKSREYVNGGLVACHRKDRSFLETWMRLQEAMAPEVGGLDRSKLTGTPLPPEKLHHSYMFSATDQDALNATVEASDIPVSILGQAAMGFAPGQSSFPHALGRPKPWERKLIPTIQAGTGATKADTAFWEYANGPIQTMPEAQVKRGRLRCKLASFCARFHRRG